MRGANAGLRPIGKFYVPDISAGLKSEDHGKEKEIRNIRSTRSLQGLLVTKHDTPVLQGCFFYPLCHVEDSEVGSCPYFRKTVLSCV